jgi:hypothetical protein
MPYAYIHRALRARRQSCTRHPEVVLKVLNLIRSKTSARGAAVFALVATLAMGAAAPLAASAEVAPQPAVVAPTSEPLVAAPAEGATLTVEATASVVPAVAPKAVAKKKLTVKQIIAKAGHDAGLSKAEVAALLWMAKRESNYHPTSESRSECHGLFQLSKGMAHGKPWKDPAWNTKRAIKYMKGRYHGVLKAKAFWMSHHWY